MDKIVEKLNIFDMFTMLLPGVFSLSLICISLADRYFDVWKSIGNEKYILFIVIAYIYGVFLQELGAICDRAFMYEELYGGKPREIFLSENNYDAIWNSRTAFQDALQIKNYFEKDIDTGIKEKEQNEKARNGVMFAYCVNTCEMNGLSGKIDRMLAISEMARSLFWGCVNTILLNGYLIVFSGTRNKFLMIETVLLALWAMTFKNRKKRFERYYVRILTRTFLLYKMRSEEKR